MAYTDKNIVITPNLGSSTDDPKIVFSGANSSVAGQNITLRAYPTNNGTLSFEGSAGQLFSVTNSMTGTIFSVNDVSGIPSISVADTGQIYMAQYSGSVNVGTGGVLPISNVVANLGSTTAWFNNIYGKATQALYADLAENYLADVAYEPGTVLMFGGEAEVTLADADTTRVAGVVSTNPATLMNGGLQGENVTPLALTGRVPTMVIGPVQKGDMMVSAGNGRAQVNNTPQMGQVIGKALENFDGTEGVIEVVVGRL
jgi:hypothetical protein